jgi:phosphoribosyl 1,2-cyclic phosphodiesterase
MITVSVLGSGSRGNATFIRTDNVRILIDAGVSRREIGKRLEAIGEDPDGIDAVLVTHEHADHASALRVIVKDLPVRAYLTTGTANALNTSEYEWNNSTMTAITPGVPFTIGDAEVTAFSVPHDATEPVAFSVRAGGVKITQLTDIGWLTDSVVSHLAGSDVLILESNHDLDMLRAGPYPWSLKQRLMGRYGHLSNTAVARFIRDQYDGLARHFVLAHLSSRNNHPEIARQEALRALRGRGIHSDCLTVTDPAGPVPLMHLV